MKTSLRAPGFAALCLLCAAVAGAQTSSTTQSQSSSTSQSADVTTRPAFNTFFGDTGLWFVPTAEVLPEGRWSAAGYRRGTDYKQGYTNVGDFAINFAYGVKPKIEVFGSLIVDTRVDRDLRPIFYPNSEYGGIVADYPRVNTGWTGNNFGDLYIGAKYNIKSQYHQDPVALAVRAMFKLPTGKDVASTGAVDFLGDFIASKEIQKVAEVAGHIGFRVGGSPAGYDLPRTAFAWGAGVGFPSRSPVRVTAEIDGVSNGASSTITGAPLVADDGSIAPINSDVQKLTRLAFTINYQTPKGVFVGVGGGWSLGTLDRVGSLSEDGSVSVDYWDWQVRVGFHPGVRIFVPPPPPAPPAPPPPPPPANRPPTVRAMCDPCTVEVGRTSTVTAVGQDPDGDVLTYRWTAPQGTFANPNDRVTVWTAPQQEGPVQVCVTASDGKGGTASDCVRIQVVRPAPVVQLTFEDVYFDFDRYSLRPEALRLLDDAVARLQANPDKQIVIEGHTCNIGTAEYNLALGERRAAAVRDYLTSRGVPASRLETRSYGEERPKFDNAREETRRLNRRAALVVKVQ
jgi:outer membrane protein OmpA-like peptidoglycan-associated protein